MVVEKHNSPPPRDLSFVKRVFPPLSLSRARALKRFPDGYLEEWSGEADGKEAL